VWRAREWAARAAPADGAASSWGLRSNGNSRRMVSRGLSGRAFFWVKACSSITRVRLVMRLVSACAGLTLIPALEKGSCNRGGQHRPAQASVAQKRAICCRINGSKVSRCNAAEIIYDK